VIKNILLVVKSLAAVSPSHSREQPVEKKMPLNLLRTRPQQKIKNSSRTIFVLRHPELPVQWRRLRPANFGKEKKNRRFIAVLS